VSDHLSLVLTGIGTGALVLIGFLGLFVSMMSGIRQELSSVRIELMTILKEMSAKIELHGERIRVVEDRSERKHQ
jgi:hypothetical protein